MLKYISFCTSMLDNEKTVADNEDDESNGSETDNTSRWTVPNQNFDSPTMEEIAQFDVSLVSPKPRSFFACESDEKGLGRLLHTFADDKYMGIDFDMACSSCVVTIDASVARSKLERLVKVHTLHHCTLKVSITDVRSPVCNRFVPYE